MFGTRLKKIFSDIRSRKIRTFLVSISIFIGVFGTVTLFTMGDLLVRQLEKDLDKDKLTMVRASVIPNPTAEVNSEGLLDTLRSQPDITTVEGQAVYSLTWKVNAGDAFRSSTIFAYSEPFDSIQLEPMRLETGAYPMPGKQELVVERRFAEKYGLQIGDSLIVQVLSENLPEEHWTIVGTVFFPYGYPGLNDVLPEDSVFANYADAQHITGFTGFSTVYVRYKDFETAEQQADQLTAAIAAEGSYIPILTYTENPDDNSRIRFARTIGSVMASLALLALFASGFLVLNVVIAIITEQKNQIGIMKSLGATRLDIITIYAGIALLYGTIGAIPGVLLGIPAGYFAAQGLATTANSFIDSFGYSARAIGLGIGMGLLIPALAAIIPAVNATRVRIIEAVTDLGISSQYGQGLLARLVGWMPLPVSIRQGLSNMLRKKGRVTLTGVALTTAVGAFMGVFATFTAIDTMLTNLFGAYNYQFSITPNDADDLPKIEELITEQFSALSIKGPIVQLAIQIDGFDKEFDPATGPPALFADGFDPAYAPYSLKIDAGKSLQEAPEGVVIAQTTADYLGETVGDSLTIYAGGHSDTFEIVGIADFPFDGVWFDWRTLAKLAAFQDSDGNPIPGGVLVALESNDPTAAEVSDEIDAINQVLMANGITASYGNIVLLNESIAQALSMFQVIFNFAAVLIALVGAIGLLTTLSMSVFERQKEIGVMRSIGATSTTIMTQFLSEGISVGILAWIIAIPVSIGIYTGMLQAMNLGDEYGGEYSIQVVIIGLAGMVLITTLASISPSIAAARKTVSDILRYQ